MHKDLLNKCCDAWLFTAMCVISVYQHWLEFETSTSLHSHVPFTAGVGAAVGASVGLAPPVGAAVGATVGLCDGANVGLLEATAGAGVSGSGSAAGMSVSAADGADVTAFGVKMQVWLFAS